MRHGDQKPSDTDTELAMMASEDPDLWMVEANMDAWAEAHPCDCDALCECEN